MEFQSEVLQRLTAIETKIDNGITKRLEDHERRVRFLEKGLYLAFGGLVVIQVLIKLIFK